jgi:hypothetical protein
MFEFIESPIFERLVYDYLTEEEYAAFQLFLAANPDAGDLMRGSGGCRKVRWSTAQKGKSGGVRVIYFARTRAGHIWLLTIYGKSAVENIPAHILHALKDELIEP